MHFGGKIVQQNTYLYTVQEDESAPEKCAMEDSKLLEQLDHGINVLRKQNMAVKTVINSAMTKNHPDPAQWPGLENLLICLRDRLRDTVRKNSDHTGDSNHLEG